MREVLALKTALEYPLQIVAQPKETPVVEEHRHEPTVHYHVLLEVRSASPM